jgi:hypothetical protein
MKIVNREAFLAMPPGTLFAKFDPHAFGEVQIKADTCGNDFVCNSLIPGFEGCIESGDYFSVLDRMMDGEGSPPLEYDSYGRDGQFDRDQLFAVFEPRDVKALMDHLTEMTAIAPEFAHDH